MDGTANEYYNETISSVDPFLHPSNWFISICSSVLVSKNWAIVDLFLSKSCPSLLHCCHQLLTRLYPLFFLNLIFIYPLFLSVSSCMLRACLSSSSTVILDSFWLDFWSNRCVLYCVKNEAYSAWWNVSVRFCNFLNLFNSGSISGDYLKYMSLQSPTMLLASSLLKKGKVFIVLFFFSWFIAYVLFLIFC